MKKNRNSIFWIPMGAENIPFFYTFELSYPVIELDSRYLPIYLSNIDLKKYHQQN